MDFLGEDDSDDSDGGEGQNDLQTMKNKYLVEVCQQIFKFILSHREHSAEHSTRSEILILLNNENNHITELIRKFQSLKVGSPLLLSTEQLNEGVYYSSSSIRRLFDFVVDFNSIEHVFDSIFNGTNSFPFDANFNFNVLYHQLNPGGYFLTTHFTDESTSPLTSLLQSNHLWRSSTPSPYFYSSILFCSSKCLFVGLKKVAICLNSSAALYWGMDGSLTSSTQTEDEGEGEVGREEVLSRLNRERELLEEITVTQTVHHSADYLFYTSTHSPQSTQSTATEQSSESSSPFLRMSSSAREKAIQALTTHGVCVIKNLFPVEVIERWGERALQDLKLASQQLKDVKGIDLDNPIEGQVINNFHELSMREARRVDLRNGSNIKQFIAEEKQKWSHTSEQSTSIVEQRKQSLEDIRSNSDILEILERSMYEITPRELGNWGRWNFNGGGPSLTRRVQLTVGVPGTVISMGGCLDQTIHADTSHIFSHVQLPPHYVNLFLPSVAPLSNENKERFGCSRTGQITSDGLLCGCCDLRIGQTVYIAGSQDVTVSDRCMNHGEEGEQEIMRRMIRPHLQTGDGLLFDCRVLHFGLANNATEKNESGESVKRPIVYVNYHHKWFNDPKNWNDNEKLFK